MCACVIMFAYVMRTSMCIYVLGCMHAMRACGILCHDMLSYVICYMMICGVML